jgi:hypothetical protein
MNFGTVVISTVFMFGGIPSTREPICPFISNVSVGVLEVEDVCALDGIIPKFSPVTYEGVSNSKRVVKTGTMAAYRAVLVITIKYELHAHY